jgi:hypothetical protein
MRIKSIKEKKNKLLIEGEIEKKNQFNKRSKKIFLRMRTKLKTIIYSKLGLNDKIKKKYKTSTKKSQEQK